MFLSEFFGPITVVAFLITFGRYFSTHWFGIFMPTVIGLEVLLFATTGGNKGGEKADQFKSSSSQASKDLQAARQRNAAQAEQTTQQESGGDTKKNAGNAKQEKANAKKAAQAEKGASTSTGKKTK